MNGWLFWSSVLFGLSAGVSYLSDNYTRAIAAATASIIVALLAIASKDAQ